MRVLGIIVARAGSKGLPGKNMRLLGDKPMLAYSLEAARKSQRLTQVIFSSDCPEMAALAARYDVQTPFLRPADLASDTAAMGDVTEHATSFLEKRGEFFDAVMTLQATSPFRTSEHIDAAIEKFEKSGVVSLIGIKKSEYPAWWLFKKEEDRIRFAFPYPDPEVNVLRVGRQFFPTLYRPNGALYLVQREFMCKHRIAFDPQNTSYFEMDPLDSVSVDTELDFIMLESILKLRAKSAPQK